jgi:hypothetical protein
MPNGKKAAQCAAPFVRIVFRFFCKLRRPGEPGGDRCVGDSAAARVLELGKRL